MASPYTWSGVATLRNANPHTSAKTASTGFLHLPRELRKRIYELAILYHDKMLVLLPRRLPRKVSFAGDRLGVDGIIWGKTYGAVESFASEVVELRSSLQSQHDYYWCGGERPSLGADQQAYIDELREDAQPDAEESVDIDIHLVEMQVDDQDEHSSERPSNTVDACITCGFVHCHCDHAGDPMNLDQAAEASAGPQACSENEESGSEGSSGENDDSETEDDQSEVLDEDGYLITPQACLDGTCTSKLCCFCAGNGLGENQDEP